MSTRRAAPNRTLGAAADALLRFFNLGGSGKVETLADTFETDRRPDGSFLLHFTPAEWRALLEAPSFLAQDDNRFQPPRSLMGVAVRIVPDHRFG